MVKKKQITLGSIEEIDNKVKELKLELAKQKGMLASKTKSVNSAKKKELRKDIARHLTKKNQMVNTEAKQQIISKVKKSKK